MRKHHELKAWPEYFQAILDGRKTFELRRDDRGFEVGDVLVLREFIPVLESGSYTGRWLKATVTYKVKNATLFGLMEGFCVLGFCGIDESGVDRG